LRGQKGDVFEGGHRVPAIAFWPGKIKPGTVTWQTAMTMDLMPTYLELAKAKAPELNSHNTLDGKSLTPVLFKGLSMPHRVLFWRSGNELAVRRGPWKLVATDKGRMMLFNLDDGIAEQNDLAEEKPGLVEELLNLYKQWEKDIAAKRLIPAKINPK
jgi:arylsulfatase A-like enzyme